MSRVCRACGVDVAAPGFHQCRFCLSLGTVDDRGRGVRFDLDESLEAIAAAARLGNLAVGW